MQTCKLIAMLVLCVCASSRCALLDAADLKGAWFDDGPSFAFIVREQTILFEFDMKEHRYRLEGDVLVIEFDDGPQRKRILSLTRDHLEWRDEMYGTTSKFHRKGVWERPRERSGDATRSASIRVAE